MLRQSALTITGAAGGKDAAQSDPGRESHWQFALENQKMV